ncbi:MAG TPA: cache domain-containing protein [Myxococcales bacterium]|jgi:two-component system NtrC family sensor kinase
MTAPSATSVPRTTLRARLLSAFTIAILIPSVVTALVATWTIRHQVRAEAQARVDSDLEAAKEIYGNNLERILDALRIHAARPLALAVLADPDPDSHLEVLEAIRRAENLDVLTALDASGKVILRVHNPGFAGDVLHSPVAQRALASRSPQAAAAIVPLSALELDGAALARRAATGIKPTPMALPSKGTRLEAGMMLTAVAPVIDTDGQVAGALLGGILLNGDNRLVDRIRDTVFQGEATPGAATIFQDDVRIATNVTDRSGQRALSTRASAEVANAVLGGGRTWHDRAFVVDDWTLAAYAPLTDVRGAVVGMLYVGVPERTYVQRMWRYLALLLGISLWGVLVAGLTAIRVANRISTPLMALERAAQAVAKGDYRQRVLAESPDEIGQLSESFNRMTVDLERTHQELRAWGANLEMKVAERTAELKSMGDQMAQREKLASIGELSAGIAHEINNPNTFIRGNIAIVAEALETLLPIADEAARRDPNLKVARLPYAAFRENIGTLVTDISSGADKIMHIVADLKKFARHDDGGLDEEVDLNAVVHACSRLAHNQVKRNAKVILELAPDLPKVKGNSQRLEQVLVNLLINAAQAIEEKQGMGTIQVRTLARPDGRVAMCVKDDGAGMTEEVRRRIFDPFFTTKRHRHGTGLGLSVSYGIVSEHGGAIEVDSAPGKGAEFRVLLPAIARRPEPGEGPSTKPEAAPKSGGGGG